MAVTKSCLQEERGAVTWGDCAVQLLAQVQLKQELELRDHIQHLAEELVHMQQNGPPSSASVSQGPDPISDLIHALQPFTSEEHLALRCLKAKVATDREWTEVDEEQENVTYGLKRKEARCSQLGLEEDNIHIGISEKIKKEDGYVTSHRTQNQCEDDFLTGNNNHKVENQSGDVTAHKAHKAGDILDKDLQNQEEGEIRADTLIEGEIGKRAPHTEEGTSEINVIAHSTTEHATLLCTERTENEMSCMMNDKVNLFVC
ncbi:uncharacterized protein LOC128491391 [Spea bombifrons]|uniref:uncharacterized protein LOC128491391 n=1 Tax=Spea bombifrons TaxID=233779 RepID=UPI00234B84E5|nr:uncharacterized protein LOC128491391 [Spea bombifrons]